jgi:hypothetical protein
MNRSVALLVSAMLATAAPARADYAQPPWERARDRYDTEPVTRAEEGPPSRSTVRLSTGPAVAFGGLDPRGGLVLALDVGSLGAGARFGGAWMRPGTRQGLSEYSGEIWVDFADHGEFHPILAAGAAVARLDRAAEGRDGTVTETIGAGVLRGTLEYVLPVRAVDARAGLDVSGSIPAIGSKTADLSPWVVTALRVGVGF